MKPLTYKLNEYNSASSTYYPAIKQFTDRLLEKAKITIMPYAQLYRRYLIDYELEDPRSIEEYAYELLNLGILWREYGNTALSVEFAPFRLLSRLGEWRKQHPKLKPLIDFFRGILLSFFLVPKSIVKTDSVPRSLRDIQQLITWLESTGDFREDAFRYVRWLGFLGMENERFFNELMEAVTEFTQWFEIESTMTLGSFTPNVDTFVFEQTLRYRWREDRFSCLRSRTEYHLNMVGAELLNRAFKNEFDSCRRKTVLAPGCMRIRSEDTCEGIKSEKGIQCTGCEASCNVNKLRELGLRKNFNVMVIPHSTDLARWASKPGEEKIGVVGVACLSVLVQGGWELKRNNVPAQCILLNECGCKKHWHEKGFPTELDVKELKKIMVQQA